jgi:hypothetical protein
MNEAINFLAWLIDDINEVTAEVGTPRDAQLKEFAEQGFLRATGSWHGTNIYEITNSGAFIGDALPLPTRGEGR